MILMNVLTISMIALVGGTAVAIGSMMYESWAARRYTQAQENQMKASMRQAQAFTMLLK